MPPQGRQSTESRTRTGTRCKPHWILSPARLPIPPFRQSFLLRTIIRFQFRKSQILWAKDNQLIKTNQYFMFH